jgi:hypothetical protein
MTRSAEANALSIDAPDVDAARKAIESLPEAAAKGDAAPAVPPPAAATVASASAPTSATAPASKSEDLGAAVQAAEDALRQIKRTER